MFSSSKIVKRALGGYTLLELLITVSVIVVISGIGVAGYLDANRTQLVVKEARKIHEDLRFAQSLASNNQKPSSGNCTTLNGYNFILDHASKTYWISPDCICPGDCTTPVMKTESLDINVTTSAVYGTTFMEFFRVLRQPSTISGGNRITVSGSGGTKKRYIVVCQSGDITFSKTDPGQYPCP